MKRISILYISTILLLTFTVGNCFGKETYIRSDETASDLLNFTLNGGSFESYGCSGQDPTYFITGKAGKITIDFLEPQTNPSFRVWGLNDDDSVRVFVNGEPYSLNKSTAAYDKKVICKTVTKEPGEEGVKFISGILVGAINNEIGNYSYQNITLLTSKVNSITLLGFSGRGWGFIGVTIGNGNAGQASPKSGR